MTVHDSATTANAFNSRWFRELTEKLLSSPYAPREDREHSSKALEAKKS